MRRLSVIIGVAALALVSTGGMATATRGQPEQLVPIAGTVTGEHAVQPQAADCDHPADAIDWWRFSSWGTGNMSRLGRVEYHLTQCTYILPPVGPVSAGTITFTAANGDTLVVAQSMQSVIVEGLPGTPPLAFMAEGTWDVVDDAGTGRFASATGSGVLDGYGDIPDGVPYFDDLPDGLALFHFDGMIAYDASNRSR